MQRLRIFSHHIYELRKGLRNLILFTALKDDLKYIIRKLKTKRIAFVILPVAQGSNRLNIFFGNAVCIEVIKKFKKKWLSDFTAEEDFILGIMLGYDRVKQCERYLQRQGRSLSKAAFGSAHPSPSVPESKE